MKLKNIIGKIKENFSVLDWGILLFFILFCFAIYQHADILHTGGSSIAYLNGHIFDFYDYNKDKMVVNNYLPTTYILFAIWNIPIRILKFITMPTMEVSVVARLWYKLGTSLVYFASAYILYLIVRKKGVSKRNSIWTAFLFLSNPIAVYSQFIFGQYDILTVFFMLLGYYYYISKNNKGFILSFAIALTLKYFSLLVFLPLLFLKEKDICKIIKNLIGYISIFLVEVLIYLPSEAFREGVFGFRAAGFIFNMVLDNEYTQISVVLVAWVFLCAYAYFKDCKNDDELFKWSIYLSCFVMFICFGLSFWHPQWLLIAIPFWTLGTLFNKKIDIYFLLEFLMMVLFTLTIVNCFPNNCDQALIQYGFFSDFLAEHWVKNLTMADLFVVKDTNLFFSMFVAVMLPYVYFMNPSRMIARDDIKIEDNKGLLRLRYIGGVLVFVIPSLICLFYNYK